MVQAVDFRYKAFPLNISQIFTGQICRCMPKFSKSFSIFAVNNKIHG